MYLRRKPSSGWAWASVWGWLTLMPSYLVEPAAAAGESFLLWGRFAIGPLLLVGQSCTLPLHRRPTADRKSAPRPLSPPGPPSPARRATPAALGCAPATRR